MKKFLAWCIIFLWATFTMPHAIVLEIPDPEWNTDVSSLTPTTQINADESTLFTSIQMINKYLWMWLWLVCMVLLVYAGIWLITANGDEAKTKTATKILIGSLVGIFICIFSYAVVKLVVNLF